MARFLKWRSELRNSTILKVNDEEVKDVKTVERLIKKCRKVEKNMGNTRRQQHEEKKPFE